MPKIENKILVPIGFEKDSLTALEYANYFAIDTKAEIILLHVIQEEGYLKSLFASDEIKEKAEEKVNKELTKWAEKLDESLKVSTIVKYGKIYEVVEDLAEEIHPNFILMGKTQNPSIFKKMLGSNAWHVIKESDYPVITISGKNYIQKHNAEKKEIILPIDLTKQMHEQLAAGLEYGKYFNATIRIISVLSKDSAAEEVKMLTQLNKTKKALEEAGVACESELLEDLDSPVYEVINNYAKKHDAHLVIIMTQQEKDFAELLIGKTAQKILETSEIPVLSITPWEKMEDSVINSFIDPLNIY